MSYSPCSFKNKYCELVRYEGEYYDYICNCSGPNKMNQNMVDILMSDFEDLDVDTYSVNDLCDLTDKFTI